MSEFETMIPIGFRFDPTDEELIGGFLWARLMGHELPWNGVVEKELYGENLPREPWEVFRDVDESSIYWHSKREGGATKNTIYAFTTLLRVPNSSRFSRRAGCGTWGGQTGPKKIKNSDTGELIGNSKMFAFEHPGLAAEAEAELGHWTMHEYSLSDQMVRLSGRANGSDLVLCKITKTIKKQQLQMISPAAIGYGVGSVHIPAEPELFYPAIGDGGGSIDDFIAQPELFGPAIEDGSGLIDVSDAQPELFYPAISDGGDSIDVSELFYPEIGHHGSSIEQLYFPMIGGNESSIEESCYPAIGDDNGSIDQLFYPAISDDESSIEESCYPATGHGGGSIDITFPAAATASNKRAAEEEHPYEEEGGGFKRQKTSCSDSYGDGDGFPDAAAAEDFLLGGDDWLPSGFDDNIDVEGFFGADFSFDNEF